jgi:predicted RNA binding protein YcfA (HicA-like mRNA interferase family)
VLRRSRDLRTDTRRPAPIGTHPAICGLIAGSLPVAVTVRVMIKLLERDGWRLVATRGSHRQYRHPTKPGRVTVPGAGGKDLTPGTLRSILKQAGLDRP